MTTGSSILAQKIPWTEEPGGLQSMGLQRVRYLKLTTLIISHSPTLKNNNNKNPKPKKTHTVYKKITSHSFMMLLMLALAQKPYTNS